MSVISVLFSLFNLGPRCNSQTTDNYDVAHNAQVHVQTTASNYGPKGKDFPQLRPFDLSLWGGTTKKETRWSPLLRWRTVSKNEAQSRNQEHHRRTRILGLLPRNCILRRSVSYNTTKRMDGTSASPYTTPSTHQCTAYPTGLWDRSWRKEKDHSRDISCQKEENMTKWPFGK